MLNSFRVKGGRESKFQSQENEMKSSLIFHSSLPLTVFFLSSSSFHVMLAPPHPHFFSFPFSNNQKGILTLNNPHVSDYFRLVSCLQVLSLHTHLNLEGFTFLQQGLNSLMDGSCFLASGCSYLPHFPKTPTYPSLLGLSVHTFSPEAFFYGLRGSVSSLLWTPLTFAFLSKTYHFVTCGKMNCPYPFSFTRLWALSTQSSRKESRFPIRSS